MKLNENDTKFKKIVGKIQVQILAQEEHVYIHYQRYRLRIYMNMQIRNAYTIPNIFTLLTLANIAYISHASETSTFILTSSLIYRTADQNIALGYHDNHLALATLTSSVTSVVASRPTEPQIFLYLYHHC